MNDKQKYGIIIAIIGIFSGGSLITYSVTTTNITDIDQNIFNKLNLDIDVEELKQLCKGEIPDKYQSACGILELIP